MNIRWPQITMIALFGLFLGEAIGRDGQAYSGVMETETPTAAIIILATLLYFGGFWTGEK